MLYIRRLSHCMRRCISVYQRVHHLEGEYWPLWSDLLCVLWCPQCAGPIAVVFLAVELSHESASLRTVISAGTAMADILGLVALGHNRSGMLEALRVELMYLHRWGCWVHR